MKAKLAKYMEAPMRTTMTPGTNWPWLSCLMLRQMGVLGSRHSTSICGRTLSTMTRPSETPTARSRPFGVVL